MKKLFRKKTLAALALTAVIALVGLGLTACGGSKELTIAVPNDTTNEARALLKVKESIYNDTVEKGYIISQNPAANEKLEKYSNVEVIVSLGSDKVNVKQIGIDKMSAENAKNVLENLGLKVNIVEQFSDNIERGMLIRYEPDMVAKGGTVTLYSSKGREIRQTQ